MASKTNYKKKTECSNSQKSKFTGKTRDKRVTNDFAWWNKYPTLTEGAGDFPFNHIKGTKLNLQGYTASLPVINTFKYVPTIGQSTSSESPFMTQVRSIWLDMHRKYRGIGSYQTSDLGVFMFCAINLFAEIARAEKIYGYYRNAQATNRAVPYTLLAAMGVNYTINARQLADFRFALNEINQKASTILLPKGFSAYQDAVILAGATIKDSKTSRAGIYTFNAEVFYTFSGTQYSTGSAAISHYRTCVGQYQTVDEIIHDLQTQLESILNDDDCATMGSDILAAYGENGVETRMPIAEDYVSPIVEDDMRLLQIHNATICGGQDNSATSRFWTVSNIIPAGATGTPSAPGLDIVQENNILYEDLFITRDNWGTWNTVNSSLMASNPDLAIASLSTNGYKTKAIPNGDFNSSNAPVQPLDRLLDTWEDSVSLEQKVEMTRFTVPITYRYCVNSSSSSSYLHLVSFGTNVLTGAQVWKKDTGLQAALVEDIGQRTTTGITKYAQLSQFDWHPIIYLGAIPSLSSVTNPSNATDYGATATEVMGDIDHSTVIRNDSLILDKLHEAAIMSAYRCELTSTSKFDVT